MSQKKIGGKLVIDGEAEFRANLASAKTALSAVQSELKLVTAQFKNNADSLEALSAKQQVYIKLQAEQKNKVSLLAEMQDKVIKKLDAEKNTLDDLAQSRERISNELENAKAVYGENSEEVKKLSEELDAVNEQYASQERIVQKTGDRVNTYQRDINNAQIELENLNSEIAENERRLNEAGASAETSTDAVEDYSDAVEECADAVDDTSDAVNEFGNEVQDSAGKTSVFADVLKAELLSDIIREGIKKIAEGIKKIATAATQTGITFEASMSQVAATMGITTKEIQNGSEKYEILNKAAQDCGKATMFSASQSAEALNYLALAGYDAEKAAATLPKVLNLAAAGGLDLAYASDLVTDSMAALGRETNELDNFIDQMAKTSQKSNTSVAQLGEATLVCAGTVALTDQNLDAMNTELGVLANNGLKGAEGGTHLRNVLLSLSAPTDKAADALSGLGLKVYSSKGKMRDLNEILTEMNSLMSEMTQREKTQLISTIFNKTDIAAVNALLKSTNGEYTELNGQINDCSGAAQEMADTLNDNLKGRVTILKSALEGLGITAYNLFDDDMKSAVDSATDSVGRLQEAIDNGELGVSMRNMSEALGEFAENAIGAAEKALPALIDGLTWLLENGEIVAGLIGGVTSAKVAYTVATEAATVAQKLFNVTANANPYIFLATAIAGVVGAITLYAKTADKETIQLTESTKKLTDASKNLNEEAATAARKREESVANLKNERDACMNLVDELDALQSKTELTAEEQARQAAIVEELNTLMPDLNLNIDEQTGKTNQSTEALRKNIDAQMELMKIQSAKEQQKGITDELVEAEIKLAELKTEHEAATDRLTEAEERLNDERERFKGESKESQEAWYTAANDCAVLKQQINETTSTINTLKKEYEQTSEYVSRTEALTIAAKAITALGDAAFGTGGDISTMSEEAIEAYNDMYESLSKSIWNQMDLFSKFSNEVKISKNEILDNMQSQIDGVSEWADNMDTLADRGINQGLLKYLAELGPQGSGYVAAFVEMSEDELKEASEMFEESLKLSNSSAMNITDSYFDAGQDATQGFIDGASGNMDEAVTAVAKLGENALGELKKELAINSPSKKTMELGEGFDEGLQKGIYQNTKNVINVIRQLTNTMLTATKAGVPPKEYEHIGMQVMEGLREGIESGKSRVLESIQTACEETIQAAKDKLDIHSPSKAFAYLGEMSGEGYAAGWESSMGGINNIITNMLPDMVLLNDEVRSAYEGMVEDTKTFCQQILDANTRIDSLGTEYEETMSDISNDTSVSKACENLEGFGEAALDAGSDVSVMSKKSIEAYHEMYSSVAEKVGSQIDLFSEFSGEAKMSAEDLLKNMQSQVTGIAQWATDMDTLADKGINQGLLQHLADMGPTGAGYVSTFVSMTDEELEQANRLFETSLVLPDATAVIITDSFAQAGKNAAKGLANGIVSGTDEVVDASESMSCDALDTVMTTLDEHSPSKKTEEMGMNFAEGLKKGVDGRKENVLNVIKLLTTSMLTNTKKGLPKDDYIEIGRRIAEGMRDGIESGRSAVLESVRSLCEETIQTAKDKLDIHSPSKAFAYLGEMSGKGYITGWEDTMENINSVIADTFPDVPEQHSGNISVNGMDMMHTARITDMCEKIYGIMAQYIPGMSKMQMVLDTGTLVGHLTPKIDNELGDIEYFKSRGVYE